MATGLSALKWLPVHVLLLVLRLFFYYQFLLPFSLAFIILLELFLVSTQSISLNKVLSDIFIDKNQIPTYRSRSKNY